MAAFYWRELRLCRVPPSLLREENPCLCHGLGPTSHLAASALYDLRTDQGDGDHQVSDHPMNWTTGYDLGHGHAPSARASLRSFSYCPTRNHGPYHAHEILLCCSLVSHYYFYLWPCLGFYPVHPSCDHPNLDLMTGRGSYRDFSLCCKHLCPFPLLYRVSCPSLVLFLDLGHDHGHDLDLYLCLSCHGLAPMEVSHQRESWNFPMAVAQSHTVASPLVFHSHHLEQILRNANPATSRIHYRLQMAYFETKERECNMEEHIPVMTVRHDWFDDSTLHGSCDLRVWKSNLQMQVQEG